MDFSKLTVKAQEAVQGAVERARARGNPELTAPHLLLALVAEKDSVADVILSASGVDTRALRSRRRGRASRTSRACPAPPPPAGRSRAWPSAPCSTARQKEAQSLGDDYVATEHLLLALLEERGRSRELLEAQGAKRDRVMEALRRPARRPARHRPERRGPLPGAPEVRRATSPARPRRASSIP